MELETVKTLLAIGASAGTAAGVLWMKIIRPAVRTYQSFAKELKVIPTLAADVRWIKEQVNTNGGTSLRDVIDRIALRQAVTDQVINAALANSSVGWFKANRAGEVIEVSRTLCRIMRRSEAELMGNSWLTWVVHDERERVRDEWEDVVRLGREMDQEFHAYTPEEARVRVHAKAHQLIGMNRQLVGFFGTITIVDDKA